MKISEIVNRLAAVAPQFTTRFSRVLNVASAVSSNNVITVTTSAAHGLSNGQAVSLANGKVEHSITSIVKDGTEVTIVLPRNHQLTEDWFVDSIRLTGVTQPAYNATFTFTRIPNRRTVVFEVPEDWADPTGASIKMIETLTSGLNGSYPVTVTGATTFKIAAPDLLTSTPLVNCTLSASHRIIGQVHIERFLENYESGNGDLEWLVVVPDDATISKDRKLNMDAVSAQGSGSNEGRQILLEPFSVFAILNCKGDGGAIKAIDACMEEIRNALIGSLSGYKFNTGFTNPATAGTSFVSHNFVAYSKAYYIHEFKFETVKEITDEDARFNTLALQNVNVAFRDITATMDNSFGEVFLNSEIDLDDEPL